MKKEDILHTCPQVDRREVQKLLSREIDKCACKVIALDDDPTGIQTVHDVSVYTDWSLESIRRGFGEKEALFFILTNSRSFTEKETEEIHREIGENLETVADGRPYLLISRGDSTLRGHYPLETETLRSTIETFHEWRFDGEILCPFFAEGGRYTIRNVHYVRYGEELIPAAETEFARDKTFGFKSSDLPGYIEEKSGGRYKAEAVICIPLEELRAMELDKIEKRLLEAGDFQKIVVNAIENVDVEVFCIALYRAIRKGKHYLFRTAAAFVKAVAKIRDRPLLGREEMLPIDTGVNGVIIIGSHTEKTTRQMEKLREMPGIHFLEMNSDLVLQEGMLEKEAGRIREQMEQILSKGGTAAVYTKRKLLEIENDTKEAALLRSVEISRSVQSLVRGLTVRPAFIVAKGGITSSDIGIKALGVKRARVLGQIQPGIPVWKTDAGSKFPDIPYIIFPGNVGRDDSLLKAVSVLMGNT